MFSFLGLRKESKKLPSDKEADGGFVIIGETASEQKKLHNINVTRPSTNVIVQPSKSYLPHATVEYPPAKSLTPAEDETFAAAPAVDPTAAAALPDLLGDVPFILAPHVAAMQASFTAGPDVLLFRDINYNLATFQYDFSLENSVLQNS